MALRKVQLFSVPVADQDRAKDFYVNILGFTLVADTPMGPDGRWVQVAPRGAETSLTLVTWFATMPPGSLKGIVVETDDLEADIAALRGHGVAIAEDIQESPWGRYVTFDDPDGNGIVLQTTTAARG
jgi:catechol 2,3-dioxygenase-like lactoylglutathione lyase family enzyme